VEKRPLVVTILGWLFIVTGGVGLLYHLMQRPAEEGIVWVSAVRLLAVVGGVFLLLGKSWARWLLVAWLGFHVAISVLHSWAQVVVHFVLLVVVALLLTRPPAAQYFQAAAPSGPRSN
jgi:hypothetical protein